jgi:predicted RNase H-like HicB family nuclease
MSSKKSEKIINYLAVDKDGCTGLGETIKEACKELQEANSGYVSDFTFYRLTKINVELKEV